MSGFGVISSELKGIWLCLTSRFFTDMKETFGMKFNREAETCITFLSDSGLIRIKNNIKSTRGGREYNTVAFREIFVSTYLQRTNHTISEEEAQ